MQGSQTSIRHSMQITVPTTMCANQRLTAPGFRQRSCGAIWVQYEPAALGMQEIGSYSERRSDPPHPRTDGRLKDLDGGLASTVGGTVTRIQAFMSGPNIASDKAVFRPHAVKSDLVPVLGG